MGSNLIHFFFQDWDLDHNTDIYLVEYGTTSGFLQTQMKKSCYACGNMIYG